MNHTKDSDCTVGDDGLCTGCQVYHGGPCDDCEAVAYHKPGCSYMKVHRGLPASGLEIGDFISVPSWKASGMVVGIAPAYHGSDLCRRVLIAGHPDEPAMAHTWYQLEPGEFFVE